MNALERAYELANSGDTLAAQKLILEELDPAEVEETSRKEAEGLQAANRLAAYLQAKQDRQLERMEAESDRVLREHDYRPDADGTCLICGDGEHPDGEGPGLPGHVSFKCHAGVFKINP